MAKAVINKDILGEAFMGISEFRYKEGSTKLIANQAWDIKAPILKGTLNFTQDEATKNDVFVHGVKKAYASTSESGAITMAFTVPSIDEETNKWLGNEASGTPASMTDMVNGENGSWIPIGKGIDLQNQKTLNGMVMIISENKKYAMIVKNLSGVSSIITDNIDTTPVAYRVTMSLEGITDDTDGDVVFMKWEKTTV